MSCGKIETVKRKLTSATKNKIKKQSEVQKLRNLERSLTEEISSIKIETSFVKEQLEGLKESLNQTKHQIAMIDICKASEMKKIQAQKDNLLEHRSGFQCLFEKERHLSEAYNKEQKERDAAEEERRGLIEDQIAMKNEQQAREAAQLEEECEALERECAVLKKRNTAIMLKLRRKLVETENIRRDLMKKKGVEVCNLKDTEEKMIE